MKQCFVISPIGHENSDIRKNADDVFDYIIKPAMEQCNIEAFRSDHLDKPGKISEQMFHAIYHADVCIADLTGYNPNVFYELAVAQSANRPVIILIKKDQVLPFDVKDLRCVQYDLHIRSFEEKTYINRIINIIKEFESTNWNVADLFTKYRKKDEFIEQIEEGVIDGLNGDWIGTVEQHLNGAIQMLDLRLHLSANSNSYLIGKGDVKYKERSFDLVFQGTYKSSRLIKLDYRNFNKRVLQFGTFVLRLSDESNELSGHFAGYGQLSGKIISGNVQLGKILS